MASLTETTPALWLARVTRLRAWPAKSRLGVVVAYLLGTIPTILFVGLMRSPGYGDLPLIAMLFVLGPVVTSAVWCSLDRDSADARELEMWLASINKTRMRIPIPDAANAALDTAIGEAIEMASRGAAPSAVLELVRSAVQGQLARHKRMGLFVAYARFLPVVMWAAVSLALVAAFGLLLLATPSCGPEGSSSFFICH